MDAIAPGPSSQTSSPTIESRSAVVEALFVRLNAKQGKGDAVETFLRAGLEAVREEPGTTSWYAVRFGEHDFAIFDTFPDDAARVAHLGGKVGQALVARSPELFDGAPRIETARILAYKLPGDSGPVGD